MSLLWFFQQRQLPVLIRSAVFPTLVSRFLSTVWLPVRSVLRFVFPIGRREKKIQSQSMLIDWFPLIWAKKSKSRSNERKWQTICASSGKDWAQFAFDIECSWCSIIIFFADKSESRPVASPNNLHACFSAPSFLINYCFSLWLTSTSIDILRLISSS